MSCTCSFKEPSLGKVEACKYVVEMKSTVELTHFLLKITSKHGSSRLGQYCAHCLICNLPYATIQGGKEGTPHPTYNVYDFQLNPAPNLDELDKQNFLRLAFL